MNVSSFTVPGILYLLFCVLGLLIPLSLAFLPIRRGLSITVKDALTDYGIRADSGKRKPALLKSKLFGRISRPVLLSLRNAMGHRKRFLMNLSMLTLGGLLFVGILSTIVSINTALSDNLSAQKYDYQIATGSYADNRKIAEVVSTISDIKGYESWGVAAGKLVYEDGNTGNSYSIMAPPHDTAMLEPEIMEGRWLQAGDSSEIVVSFEFMGLESAYTLGDTVSFQIGDTNREFTIVGTVKEIGVPSIYMNLWGFEQIVPEHFQQNSVKMATVEQRGSKRELYHQIEEQFIQNQISVLQAESKTDQFDILSSHFTTTLVSFLVVAAMAVCVAGFGLASTMSVQIAERTREIGIMKAMGANARQVKSTVTSESIFVCLLSWAVSLVLGIPVTALSIYVIGTRILEIPLELSPAAIVLSLLVWLLLTLLIGKLASGSAAKRAQKMSVKAALAFE